MIKDITANQSPLSPCPDGKDHGRVNPELNTEDATDNASPQ